MSYFDQPRPAPRYQGVSDPVSKTADERTSHRHVQQAMQRALLEWGRSADAEHWWPSGLTVEVVDDHSDFFIRDARVFLARAVGEPVLDAGEMARAEQLEQIGSLWYFRPPDQGQSNEESV